MRKGRKAMKIILLLLLAGVVCFAAAMGVLTLMEKRAGNVRPGSAAIIVLGAQVKQDGQLSVQLEKRMEAALAEYQRQPRPVICCGAQGANEPRPEAEAMRDWLIARGVPETDVIAEAASNNTLENLKNAKALLPAGEKRVTVVTSDYHLPRAMAIARDAGLDADGIGSPCKPEYWLKNHSREVLAWGKYFLRKIVPIG